MSCTTRVRRILRDLPAMHDGKFGFTVHRCVYGDDDAWERFIHYLTLFAYRFLDRASNGEPLKPLLSWDVQEDEQNLNGASKLEVRRRFRKLVDERSIRSGHPRYHYCIHADDESVDSVLKAGDDRGGFVNFLSTLWKEDLNATFDEQDEEEEDVDEDESESDEDSTAGEHPPIEGRTEYDVGWMKVDARVLISFMYLTMDTPDGWDMVYVRPPLVSHP